jgi:CheY-like chemotaxis protein
MMRSAAPPPKPPSTAGLRVLLCEDDPLTALDFADILRNGGWQVVGPVHTAEEALAESYRRLPDVALIDIGLKGMIDGISVAAELAPLGVPVIFLTGNYQRAGHEGRELATDILIKPVSEKAILRAVAAALHLNQG